jgi:hypothetical protein
MQLMAKMAEQMELFEPVERGFDEGGLMDEGGTVDPISGNDVPPGSTQEEVRDDIPAQLSEGEFVVPADVVRYVGLENLMRMRQEAKQGLSQMEAMGQMGNSEEATVEDDMPFDMYDLDIDDEGEYNSDELKMQTGGMVPSYNPQTGTYNMSGTGISGFQPPQQTPNTGFTPYTGTQPYMQPLQYTGTQYTTADQTTNIPTFGQMVGSGYQGSELRTYVNDAGQTLQIPFVDGKPVYPIPEGYRPIGDQPAPEEAPTTVTPTLGQTQVRDDDTKEKIKTESYGGSPGTFSNKATQQGLAMFSEEFDEAINPLKNPLSKVNVVSTVLGAVNPLLGLVVRATITKQTFDNEIKRLAENYSFFTEESLRAELGNLATSSQDYANAQKAIEDAIEEGNKTAQAEAQKAADEARSDFGNSAARMAGVTEAQGPGTGGIAGIEASGVAPGPGAPLGADKQSAAPTADSADSGNDNKDNSSSGSDPSSNEGFGGGDDKGQVGSMDFKSGGLAKQMKQSGLASKK